MEAELEEMLVGAWFQGERAKLLLRVESVERELSSMASGSILQQQAFEAQKQELSSRATREEMQRRICERRVQDLEREVMLLSEQIRASGKALRRERANNNRSRESSGLSIERVPTLAAPNQPKHESFDAEGTSYEHPSFGPTLCVACDGRGRGKDGGGREVAGQLGVGGTPFEENVQQMKSEGRRLRRRRQEHAQPARVTTADTTTTRPRTKGVGERGAGLENAQAEAKDDELLGLDMALSKIEALTGMIRAQEEIETLLSRELDELKSRHAGDHESVWRLLSRWSRVLKKKGYDVTRDARSEGVLHELQQRIDAENRELGDGAFAA